MRPRVLVRLLQVSEAPLMGRVAPRANLHSARLSWVAADIRPIRDSRRRLAASTNRERRKSLRTLQGQFRLPRLSGNHHRVRCSAQMDSRANTCVAPQLDQFISRAGWRTGSASPRRARRQRVAVVRYAQPEPNGRKMMAVNWELFVIAVDYAGVRAAAPDIRRRTRYSGLMLAVRITLAHFSDRRR